MCRWILGGGDDWEWRARGSGVSGGGRGTTGGGACGVVSDFGAGGDNAAAESVQFGITEGGSRRSLPCKEHFAAKRGATVVDPGPANRARGCV